MLLRQTLLYLPAQVLGPLFQLVAAFVWTHYLAPGEMGLFALVSAAQELAFATAMMWFALYTVRYFDGTADEAELARFHASESAVMIAASVAMAAGLAVLPIGNGAALKGLILASAVLYVLTRCLVSYLAERARVEGDTLTYTALQSFSPVAGFLVSLVLVRLLPADAATVLLGYSIAQAFSIAFALTRLNYSLRPQDWELKLIRRAMKFGLPVIIGGLFVWIANNGVRFLIEWKLGLEAVGLVTVGWALGLRGANFASMLTTAAAFPLAVRRAREAGYAEGQAQLVRNGVLLGATLAPAIAGMIVIGKPVIGLMVAAPYRDTTEAVLPLALIAGAVRAVRIHFPNQVYLLHERSAATLRFDVWDGVLAVVFGFAGLLFGGVVGCVAGVAVASFATLAVAMEGARREYGFTFPFSDFARIGAATALMMLSVHAYDADATALSLGTAIALGALVYAASLSALYPGVARRSATLLQGVAWKFARRSPRDLSEINPHNTGLAP